MSPRLSSAAPGPQLLREWKRLTQSGIQASRDACPAKALAWHERALRVAHQLFHDAPAGVCDDDRLAAFVVAHLNLADCFNTLRQPSSAGECIHCAHHHLLALTQDDNASAALQAAAGRHLRYTFAALAEQEDRGASHTFGVQPIDIPSDYPPPGALLH